MSKLGQTLGELSEALTKARLGFVLTRFNPFRKKEPEDIDVLVRLESFSKAITALEKSGYKSFSHDQALGGRIKGAQVNLVKPNRTKIDLHKDFTWRKSRYFDLSIVWNSLKEEEVAGVKVKVPSAEVDAFIVIVNIIFEKTYITKEDWEYLREGSFDSAVFAAQARKYGWEGSYKYFMRWWQNKKAGVKDFPVFLPLSLILRSYLEKFDLISFLYYFFFRARYLLVKTLPYD